MRDYLIKPLVGQPYPMISHGKGVYLYDQNGNKYFDGSSGQLRQDWAWRKGDCGRYQKASRGDCFRL